MELQIKATSGTSIPSRSTTKSDSKGWRYWLEDRKLVPVLLTAFFFLFSLFNIQFHELWPDETEPWLLARDSSSIAELFYNKRYEGHPNLWYLILYVVTSFTHNPEAMQYLHVVISSLMVFTFVKYAPFPWYIRLLFPFGYFTLYEFTVISRLYSLGILFLFIACALLSKKKKNWILISIALALAANANVFAFIIAGVVVAYVLTVYFLERKLYLLGSKKMILTSGVILVAGSLFSMYGMYRPPEENRIEAGILFHLYYFNSSISSIWHGFAPIITDLQPIGLTNIVYSLTVRSLLSVGIVLLITAILNKKPVMLFYFFGGTLIFSIIFFTTYTWSSRHFGHHFISFLILLWLAEVVEKGRTTFLIKGKRLSHVANQLYKYRFIILTPFFFFQIIGAASALSQEYKTLFSNTGEVSDFICKSRSKKILNAEIAAYDAYIISPVAAICNRKIYYINEDRVGSFYIPLIYDPINENEMLENLYTRGKELNKDILIIHIAPFEQRLVEKYNLSLQYIADKSPYEHPLYIYLLSK